MKKNTAKIILLLILGLPLLTIAQEKTKLSISGDFRTISEFRQGYKVLLPEFTDPALVIGQRSRLIFDYKSTKFDLRFSFQDVRAWGETFIINSSKSLLVHEAYIKYHFNPKMHLTIGRKALSYGDNRIFADRNWNLAGSAHDVALFQFSERGLEIDFGFAYNNNTSGLTSAMPYSVKQYQSMSFLWITKTFSPKIKLHFVDVFAGYQKFDTPILYGLNTLGLNPVFNTQGFEFNSSAYFQFGKNNLGNKHRAFIYTTNLSYSYQFISAKVGYDHYSGKAYDDSSSTDKHFYDLIESVSHKFFGFMDFHKGDQFQKEQGIKDLNFYLKYGKKTSLTAYFHALSYSKQTATGLSKKIGNEFDFVFNHKFAENHAIDIGYSFLLPHADLVNSAFGAATDAAFAQWVWVRLTFKPKLM